MNGSLFQQWQPAFLQHVQDPSTATPLKAAAVNAQLADWTTCLTTAVVRFVCLTQRTTSPNHRLTSVRAPAGL